MNVSENHPSVWDVSDIAVIRPRLLVVKILRWSQNAYYAAGIAVSRIDVGTNLTAERVGCTCLGVMLWWTDPTFLQHHVRSGHGDMEGKVPGRASKYVLCPRLWPLLVADMRKHTVQWVNVTVENKRMNGHMCQADTHIPNTCSECAETTRLKPTRIRFYQAVDK